MEKLDKLVNELRNYPNETEWIEFKHDNYDPKMIGSDISALANSAALKEKTCAYMVWGIDDKSHDIIGTTHNLQTLKKGNQELENWLRSLLSDNANFEYHIVHMDEKDVGVLIIYSAANQPVTFEKVDYIRIGSYTKSLKDYPEIQAQLWEKLRNAKFEEQYAAYDLDLREAINALDYSTYFDLSGIPQPEDIGGVAHYLLEEMIIDKQDNGLFAVTNLGAILFAKRLTDFPQVSRKAVRIVQYSGNNKLNMLKNETVNQGYAIGFQGIIKYIEALIPTQESIVDALRERKSAYPMLAIREAVANALIHQDFSIKGTGPVVEVFENRMEITNSGKPLIEIKRIVDNPPRSRNERLATLMRRLKMCEELGTGWDKMVITCELMQIPAPKIEECIDSTRVTLFSYVPFTGISTEDKLWACYLHACIKHIQGEQLTNSSLRERFGLEESASGTISRLIKKAVALDLIKPLDSDTAPRYMRYIPIWD